MKKIIALLLVVLLTLCAASLALADPVQKGNTYNPRYATNTNIMAAAQSVVFNAIDAYGNVLDDEVTIASGGSYFIGFATNISMNNPYLFWNVGWNLDSLTSITYDNQIPAADNNYVGGIHIDVAASAGQTVYLDFYICPKVDLGPNEPPVNWATMTRDYVIKKIIKINIVGGTNTAADANGAVNFQKPIPEGYTLSVQPGAADPHYTAPSGAATSAIDLTVKTTSNGDYPISRNNMNIQVDVPAGLEGKGSYVVKYVNPYTGQEETHAASIINNQLAFATNHLSTYIIEGYGSSPSGSSAQSIIYTGGNSFKTHAVSAPKSVLIDGAKADFTFSNGTLTVSGIDPAARWVTVVWDDRTVTASFAPDLSAHAANISIPKTGDMGLVPLAASLTAIAAALIFAAARKKA